ncbi:MAG: hypothetical protein JO182_19485 [Acidobacteriaceae bacterium]|nr:hypothetical protein [Acidobacteriaceae bacterium]MBV9036681.1 hypothetical protein [Acidobacteriaceae bacterium]MBV9225611.1 hypothetical protein [Acidobacteriaceae bacterium]
MKLISAVLFCSLGCLGADPRLVFTKAFPGSLPPYVSISVEKTGDLQYKESPTDDQPVKAKLSESEVNALFALAEKLDFFKTPLESGLKVANTGKKTFRYEPESGPPTESTFNYSTMIPAQQLLDRFEQLSSTEQAYLKLDRAVHFDKLGVNDALADIESLWLHKQLAAPAQFVPLLTRIAGRESFMHLVRERAARLKDQFTGAVGQTAVSAEGKTQ